MAPGVLLVGRCWRTSGEHDDAPGPGSGAGADVVRRLASWSGARVAQLSMTASTSRAERMRYSSPLYLTSVPPYLL